MRPFNMGLSTQNIHNRKDHTEFGKIPPLIEKILKKIQQLKNAKIYKEMYGLLDGFSVHPYIC